LGPGWMDEGDVDLDGIPADVGTEKLWNFDSFTAGTRNVHVRVSKMEGTDMLLALGGECSLIVGEMAGLRERLRGRPGLIWMDSHGDFNIPDTTPSGYIGGMCLAFTCGRGPSAYERIDSLMPLVRPGDVLHLGSRVLDEEEKSAMLSSGMGLVPSKEMKRKGAVESAAGALRELERRVDYLVFHLDLDVLDPEFLPAVNYREPGGLTPGELAAIMRLAVRSSKLKALNVAAYNPRCDHHGESAARIIKLLVSSFGPTPV